MTDGGTIPDRLQAAAAERGLLGCILRDADLVLDGATRLVGGADGFFAHAHAVVFEACRELAKAGRAVKLDAVHAHLLRTRQAAELGPSPAEALADLFTAVPTGVGWEWFAEEVRDASVRRKFRHALLELLRDTDDPTGPAAELLERAERSVRSLADASADEDEPVALPELVKQALADLDERAAGRVPAGLETGLADLDALLGGMRPGQLVVVGARPGAGKTALALALLAHVCRRSNVPGYLASLEMPRGEIANRLLAMGTGVNLHRITRGKVTAEDAAKLAGALSPDVYGKTPLYIDDRSHSSSARLHAQVRRMARRHGVRFAAVDYLQLLTPADPRDGRVQQVGQLARDCKQMARDQEMPLLLLSQLNRQSEGRGDGKPKLSDLRESGEIEQHADAVVLLHVLPGQSDESDYWQVGAIVAKNRNGPVGEVPLMYRRSCVRFENAARGYDEYDRRAA